MLTKKRRLLLLLVCSSFPYYALYAMENACGQLGVCMAEPHETRAVMRSDCDAVLVCLPALCGVGIWLCNKTGYCTTITKLYDTCEAHIIHGAEYMGKLVLCQAPDQAVQMNSGDCAKKRGDTAKNF